MTQPVARTRLEQLCRAAHLSLADFVERFREVSAEIGPGIRVGDGQVKRQETYVTDRQVRRWLAGESGQPRPVACRVLEHWFAEPIDQLLGPPLATESGTVVPSDEEFIMAAGRDSVDHAIHAASALDPSALEQLHAEAQRAARAYYTTPPLRMATDLVRLRDTVYEQLDRTHKPRQQAELYLIAGQVCGLLSSVSWDLGYPDMADEQARAAHTYGSVIDHPSLCAWARALQVTVAFWSDRPRRAAGLASGALETAPPGTARARLHAVHARSLAMIGARQEVETSLALANDELDRAGDDALLDETGGELGFDRARRALCGGAAYVALGDGERAEAEAMAALDLFEAVPESVRWDAGALGATLDLGAARTLRGDLAGAEDALSVVFELAPDRRTEALRRRLINLGHVLGTSRYRGAVEAGRMGEAIEDFTARRISRTATRLTIEAAE